MKWFLNRASKSKRPESAGRNSLFETLEGRQMFSVAAPVHPVEPPIGPEPVIDTPLGQIAATSTSTSTPTIIPSSPAATPAPSTPPAGGSNVHGYISGTAGPFRKELPIGDYQATDDTL